MKPRFLNKIAKVILILAAFFLIIAIGALYYFNKFLKALAPPEITITQEYISTNYSFINGVIIEKLTVDSMGNEDYPVKYVVTYRTRCSIVRPVDKSPKKIKFKEEGRYTWNEENVNIPFTHEGMERESTDSAKRVPLIFGEQQFATCPIKFERGQWYFFIIGDPRTTGIFFRIDENGKEHQYYIESGVCPI